MKKLRIYIVLIIISCTINTLAQDSFELKGNWKSEIKGETTSYVYTFKKEEGQTVGYLVKIIDASGNIQQDETKILENIAFAGNKGKASYNYKWEGKIYKVTCQLAIVSSTTILVKYDGYDKKYYETWTKI